MTDPHDKTLPRARAAALVALACAAISNGGAQAAEGVAALTAEITELTKANAALERRLDALEPQPAPSFADYLASAAQAPAAALQTGGPLTFKGVTIFGALDAGVAYQSRGVPMNGAFPQGIEYGVSKNSDKPGFRLAPGGMGYSGIGVKGSEQLLPGLAGVFAAYTNFNPLSGQLSNGPASLVQNNGLPLTAQSANGDSRSAGQAFNDYAYVGLSSERFGVLTFGRQRTLTTDDRSAYDPIASSLAFSLLGYSSTLSSGDTENSRFDEAVKYRVTYGPVRFGAIYKFAPSGTGAGQTSAPTYQLSTGFDYDALSFDATYSHVSGAITLSSLSAAQVATKPAQSLAATISDNQAVLVSAKYTTGPLRLYVGYEYYIYSDPKTPLLAPYTDYNGYLISVATNNAYQYHHKVMQLFWTGFRYAYDPKIDISLGYYLLGQNSYGKQNCWSTKASTCGGAENALGAVAEYHFNRQLKAYGGLMYTVVTNGMASGFLHANSVDPTVGMRYEF